LRENKKKKVVAKEKRKITKIKWWKINLV